MSWLRGGLVCQICPPLAAAFFSWPRWWFGCQRGCSYPYFGEGRCFLWWLISWLGCLSSFCLVQRPLFCVPFDLGFFFLHVLGGSESCARLPLRKWLQEWPPSWGSQLLSLFYRVISGSCCGNFWFLHFSWSAGWGEVEWSSASSSSLSQSWEVKFQILIFHFLSFCCPSHRTSAVDRASFAPSVRILERIFYTLFAALLDLLGVSLRLSVVSLRGLLSVLFLQELLYLHYTSP